jgi:3',5'-cyclic AMP phosphodiesterase CpdA
MFVLGHISDPHLAPLPAVRAVELVGKRITGFTNWHRGRRLVHDPAVLGRIVSALKAASPDHIAVTGDLANLSLAAEFARAREWLTDLGTPDHVTLVPGNHDAYVRGALAVMQATCGAYMCGDDGESFPFLRRRGPLALIGLSTAVPTAPWMATGTLGGEQLTRLGLLLAETNDCFRVVLIHHPPVSPEPRYKRLTDSAAFLAVVAAHGAELVIHGHDHEHELHWLTSPAGRIPAIGVPSASAAPGRADEPAAFNLYRIEKASTGWRCEAESHRIAGDRQVTQMSRMDLTA